MARVFSRKGPGAEPPPETALYSSLGPCIICGEETILKRVVRIRGMSIEIDELEHCACGTEADDEDEPLTY